ncbi:6581_t:CDS:1, partial [Cetraspora pellucida]
PVLGPRSRKRWDSTRRIQDRESKDLLDPQDCVTVKGVHRLGLLLSTIYQGIRLYRQTPAPAAAKKC